MSESKRYCGFMVEATNNFRLHPTSISYVYKVFYHLDRLWMDIWGHPYTVILVQVGVQCLESWGVGEAKCCCGVMVEATNSFRKHPTSISYVYKVF